MPNLRDLLDARYQAVGVESYRMAGTRAVIAVVMTLLAGFGVSWSIAGAWAAAVLISEGWGILVTRAMTKGSGRRIDALELLLGLQPRHPGVDRLWPDSLDRPHPGLRDRCGRLLVRTAALRPELQHQVAAGRHAGRRPLAGRALAHSAAHPALPRR